MAVFSLALHMTDGENPLGGLFDEGTDPTHGCPALMTSSPPKSPTSWYHHTGGSGPAYEFVDTQAFSLEHLGMVTKSLLMVGTPAGDLYQSETGKVRGPQIW